MANGNQIFTAGEPRGVLVRGIIDGTPKPGQAVNLKPAVARDGNNLFTYRASGRDFDGQPAELIILDADWEIGRLKTDAYVSGTPFKGYIPLVGERCNLLVKASSGAVTIGKKYMVEASSGLFIPVPAYVANYSTGGLDAESEVIAAVNLLKNFGVAVARALEAASDPAENTHIWMEIIRNC